VRIGILVSGRGSNLEAILAEARASVEPVIVISNRAGVRALEVASARGVPSVVLSRSAFGGDAAARDAAVAAALNERDVELAVLAGYDQVLTAAYFRGFAGRTINVHPSLLPAHGGRGMVGMAVHAAVLASGDDETGATVHEVTAELDAGPVLAQSRVPVLPGDDADALAARVLEVEHRLLVDTLHRVASGRLTPI
jgi:phosphoribosylglycinamide formyltransferase 1